MKKLKGIRAVVTDADNTLYSWIEYIVPSLEAMTDALCRGTGFTRDVIVASMKKVFSAYSTNEYAFVLQSADIFEEMRRRDYRWFQEHVINPARFSFNRARKMHLNLYPGVHKTLHVLCSHGIRIIGLSDAPSFSAEQRLKHLKVDKYFQALYALKSYPVPRERSLDEAIVNRMKMGYYRSHINRVVELPLSFEKPSIQGLKKILEDEQLRPEKVVVIGDSLKKDIRVAREMGIANVWARYGTVVPKELKEKLNYYSAPEIQRRNVPQTGEVPYEPMYTVDRFDQLLEIIDLPPWRMEGVTAPPPIPVPAH